MTSFSSEEPRQPDDDEYQARDALDEIDEVVARITDADIDERLGETLRRAGYAADQNITAMSTCPGVEDRILAVISACSRPKESMESARRPQQVEAAAPQEAALTDSPSMRIPDTVTAEMAFPLVVPAGRTMQVVANLLYSSGDPYAVTMAFHVGLAEPVEWILSRDLLAVGAVSREGFGDVRVWPGHAENGSQILNIELSSPFGQALFEAPAADVAAFLARTYQLVPEGSEADHVDIDAELFSFRASGGP